MTHGEAGLCAFFIVSALFCLFAAAKAVDAPFAFHASLSAVASLAAVFFILDRYFDRPSSPPAQEINGKPNYNMGPIKFAAAISVFVGLLGFLWSLKSGQYDDLEGAAWRAIADDEPGRENPAP